MGYLQLDDVRLFFTDSVGDNTDSDDTDEGDPAANAAVLLVHGYSADSHDWSWQIPHLRTDHRVVAADLRGHGASSVPDAGYITEQFAADLVALLDHLGIDRVIAVGHSMGGSIVSTIAVEHPDRVAALIASDPAYLMDDEIPGALIPVLDAIDDADLVGFVQGIVGEGMDTPDRDPALRTWQVRRIAEMAPHALRTTMRAQVSGMATRSASEPYLARRRCPVLSFQTDPARAALEATTFADPRSDTVVWEGSNHWLHQVRAAEFNARCTEWLSSLGLRVP